MNSIIHLPVASLIAQDRIRAAETARTRPASRRLTRPAWSR